MLRVRVSSFQVLISSFGVVGFSTGLAGVVGFVVRTGSVLVVGLAV